MANNVTAAKPKTGGAVAVAAAGTTLPTDATTALAAAFTQLGYISDNGLTNSNSISSESVKAWGGDEVLVTYGGREDTFSFTLLEATNVDVLKQVFGSSNVSGTLAGGITISAKSNLELPEQVWAIDMILKDNSVKRIVIPAGRVTDIGDVSYTDNDAVGYEITISASADASGNTHYEYIKGATGATGATNG